MKPRIKLETFLPMIKEDRVEEFRYLFGMVLQEKYKRTDTDIEGFFKHISDWAMDKYGISEAEIIGGRRLRDITIIRTVAMYACRAHFGESVTLMRIAHYFNRDHSTVIHAIGKINNNLRFDKILLTHLLSLHEFLSNRGIYCLADAAEPFIQVEQQ